MGELQVTKSGVTRLSLVLPNEVNNVEIRLRAGSAPTPPFRFLGCIIRRTGTNQGIHQREAMLALIEIVRARLNRAY